MLKESIGNCSSKCPSFSESIKFSISVSCDSLNLNPSSLNNLIPLSADGLWEAVTAIPKLNLCSTTDRATAGVGTTPSLYTAI